MASAWRVLVVNGVVSLPLSETPPTSLFLENHPGAYTTSRTHNGGSSLLFWDRHLVRLRNSARILLQSNPILFGSSKSTPISESLIPSLLQDCLREAFSVASEERDPSENQEMAVTALISANSNVASGFDSYIHLGLYQPPKDDAARLALAGPSRELAEAKYSDWVRRRRNLENMRPPWATELLLSNDGDALLEGTVTNFFVVCRREMDVSSNSSRSNCSFEVQTAPLRDGVLPGVIRQLIIEICSRKGIPFREVTPVWSSRSLWEEAFITNGLRLVQPVELIQAPDSWEEVYSKTWKEVSWVEKRFEVPGPVTAQMQREIMESADVEGLPVRDFL